MMNLTVIEKVDNGYLCEFEFDGETWEKVIDYKELMINIKTRVEANINIEYLVPVEEVVITIEKYDEEYDVILNTWIYTNEGVSYKDKFIKTYKRLSSAIKLANSFGHNVEVIY